MFVCLYTYFMHINVYMNVWKYECVVYVGNITYVCVYVWKVLKNGYAMLRNGYIKVKE